MTDLDERTFHDAETYALRVEAMRESRKRPGARPQPNQSSKVAKRLRSEVEKVMAVATPEKVCYFCNKKGHVQKDCWIKDPSKKPTSSGAGFSRAAGANNAQTAGKGSTTPIRGREVSTKTPTTKANNSSTYIEKFRRMVERVLRVSEDGEIDSPPDTPQLERVMSDT